VSAAKFEQALKAFEGVVGKGWVLATDEDRDAYSDIYAPGLESEWPASAALAPAGVEEVQAIVRLANEYKTPLWPTSRGKNLGYGANAPRMPGSVVLDLGRMNRILDLDVGLGYCVLEPGVGFFDLYEHLQREKAPLWMSVPGNAWGSVIGNALDHGIGYTPYGLHARNLCGMEVVLPDGDLLRTGMGAMQGNHSWHLFPLSFGPDWTHMFTQSNMGVVTKAGVWLQPAPESSLMLTWDIPKEEDIGWVIDTITPLKIAGVIEQNAFIPSWLGKIVLKGQRKDFWDKPGAMPESRVQELLKEHNLGYWMRNSIRSRNTSGRLDHERHAPVGAQGGAARCRFRMRRDGPRGRHTLSSDGCLRQPAAAKPRIAWAKLMARHRRGGRARELLAHASWHGFAGTRRWPHVLERPGAGARPARGEGFEAAR
jgi:4-cresol dehydrogenase (hydroxylating)